MRFILLMVALLSLELSAAETVQDDVCAQGDCQQQSVKKEAVHAKQSVSTSAAKVQAKQSIMGAKTQKAMSQESAQACEPAVSKEQKQPVLKPHRTIVISVVGQGVAPVNTTSPAQAYALAKRAAIADGYRQIAEKIKGVEIEGQDLIKNMMVKRSTVRTAVYAIVKNANVVETTFRDGLCEVEMEIRLSYDALAQ